MVGYSESDYKMIENFRKYSKVLEKSRKFQEMFTSLLNARGLSDDCCSLNDNGSWSALGAVGKRFGVS